MNGRCLLAFLFFSGVVQAQVYTNQGNVVSVTGDAEIKVIPNQVVLSLGVETRDRSLAVARVQNDSLVRSVLDAIARFQVDPTDVQTDFIQVNIRYQSSAETVVDHYVVEKSIAVTLKDVSKFEPLLTAVLEAGANHIYNVEFVTTELRKYRDQARALAAKAAIEKANDLAAAAGLKVVGKPMNVSSYSYGGGSWYGRLHTMGANVTQNVYQTGDRGAAEGTIALGKISVTASVSMNFRIE
ncbi:MAG TPA: SIMPL domain-containing protein [Bryobacteraceae bacterium]|nr:SIMPL domain-containing protein [Bryobacteraceae bacterium]